MTAEDIELVDLAKETRGQRDVEAAFCVFCRVHGLPEPIRGEMFSTAMPKLFDLVVRMQEVIENLKVIVSRSQGTTINMSMPIKHG